MEFETQLHQGHFLKRYKRFFADIEYKGEVITAHCPNTGSLMGLNEPGTPCLFSTSTDPNRKLPHTLQMIKSGETWVGVNTGLPNKLVLELFENSPLPHWKKYDRAQGEVKITPESRIDMVLWNSKDHDKIKKWKPLQITAPLRLIEIKNVTLAQDERALFPDAVTSRGTKHLNELIHFKENGFDCEMVFVVQREDCKTFAPAVEIDPVYSNTLKEAQDKGVMLTALACTLSTDGVSLTTQSLAIEL